MPWFDISEAVNEIDLDAVIPLRVAATDIILIGAAGNWWAIEEHCSHAGCSFVDDGEIDGLIAVCNCHGSEFDVKTGTPLTAPATQPLRTFPVRVDSRRVEVEV